MIRHLALSDGCQSESIHEVHNPDAMKPEAIKFKWWMAMHFVCLLQACNFPIAENNSSLPHLSSTPSKKVS